MKLTARMCLCSACNRVFAGLTVFDLHRVKHADQGHPHYGSRCMQDEELALIGSEQVKGVWRTPLSEAQKQRFKRLHDEKIA